MNRRSLIAAGALTAALAGVGMLTWHFGVQQGLRQAGSDPGAPVDPSRWSIAQGEQATRRHVVEGLKAGDIDPVAGRRIQNYHDPMVPGKHFEAPGKSPFMDMMLVPRYAGTEAAPGSDEATGVTVSSRMQQNLGWRSAEVVEGSLTAQVEAVGSVAWNERLQQIVSARAMGFVERLHVRAALDRVAAGEPLVDLHVPDWVAAQEEFLAVARMNGQGLDALRDASIARMRQVGMGEPLIERVTRELRVLPRVTLTAPIGGVVSELMVREGDTVLPGTALLKLQGTGTVWVEGQVPESQAALLRPGAAATATSPSVPGRTFTGRVQMLLPAVDPATRTLKARLELPNPGARLVPGMLVQMRFAQPGRPRTLLVPSEAVIPTGRRSVVMLAEPDGRFRPVEVKTGVESGDQTEIVDGLSAGQQVVLSGQFLIDSEASLRGLELRLNSTRQPPPASDAAPSSASRPVAALPPASAVPAPPAAVASHRTAARIKAIDGDTLTLDHPPIPSLQWPRMTMDFRLPARTPRPPGLAPDDPVQVEFQMQDGDVPRITSIQRAAPGTTR